MLKVFTLSFLLFFSVLSLSSYSQPLVEVFATGLTNPIGLAVDNSGNLWVGEQGTGSADGQISVITPSGVVHTAVTDMPSALFNNEPIGPARVYFDTNGDLLVITGGGSDSLSGSLLRISVTGFSPGDPPLDRTDIVESIDISAFVLGEGYIESNPYNISLGPDDNFYINDAAANAMVKLERGTNNMSIFAEFDDLQNNSGIGPPFVNAVPTGIEYDGMNFYVTTLTGFPFVDGLAKVYEVDLQGNETVYVDGLQTLVDAKFRTNTENPPINGDLYVLKHAEFNPSSGFINNSGVVYRIENQTAVEIVLGMNLPSGMTFNNSGVLFVSELTDGEIIKISGLPTSVENEDNIPAEFSLHQNYPNPFNPSTTISWQSVIGARQTLKIFDVLGNEVITLVDEYKPAGTYEVTFDAAGLSTGIYTYTLYSGNLSESRKMLLLK